MKIFYIDFENVKDKGLNGIAKLHSEDVVRIYYSEDANKITFEYSCAMKSRFRKSGNQMSGKRKSSNAFYAYSSLLAKCFV